MERSGIVYSIDANRARRGSVAIAAVMMLLLMGLGVAYVAVNGSQQLSQFGGAKLRDRAVKTETQNRFINMSGLGAADWLKCSRAYNRRSLQDIDLNSDASVNAIPATTVSCPAGMPADATCACRPLFIKRTDKQSWETLWAPVRGAYVVEAGRAGKKASVIFDPSTYARYPEAGSEYTQWVYRDRELTDRGAVAANWQQSGYSCPLPRGPQQVETRWNNAPNAVPAAPGAWMGPTTFLHSDKCFLAGPFRKIDFPGLKKCSNSAGVSVLRIQDGSEDPSEQSAFNWACDDSSGHVQALSTGFATGKSLYDLLSEDGTAWKRRYVKLCSNASGACSVAAASPKDFWWAGTPVANPHVGRNSFGLTVSAEAVSSAEMAVNTTAEAEKVWNVDDVGGMIITLGKPSSSEQLYPLRKRLRISAERVHVLTLPNNTVSFKGECPLTEACLMVAFDPVRPEGDLKVIANKESPSFGYLTGNFDTGAGAITGLSSANRGELRIGPATEYYAYERYSNFVTFQNIKMRGASAGNRVSMDTCLGCVLDNVDIRGDGTGGGVGILGLVNGRVNKLRVSNVLGVNAAITMQGTRGSLISDIYQNGSNTTGVAFYGFSNGFHHNVVSGVSASGNRFSGFLIRADGGVLQASGSAETKDTLFKNHFINMTASHNTRSGFEISGRVYKNLFLKSLSVFNGTNRDNTQAFAAGFEINSAWKNDFVNTAVFGNAAGIALKTQVIDGVAQDRPFGNRFLGDSYIADNVYGTPPYDDHLPEYASTADRVRTYNYDCGEFIYDAGTWRRPAEMGQLPLNNVHAQFVAGYTLIMEEDFVGGGSLTMNPIYSPNVLAGPFGRGWGSRAYCTPVANQGFHQASVGVDGSNNLFWPADGANVIYSASDVAKIRAAYGTFPGGMSLTNYPNGVTKYGFAGFQNISPSAARTNPFGAPILELVSKAYADRWNASTPVVYNNPDYHPTATPHVTTTGYDPFLCADEKDAAKCGVVNMGWSRAAFRPLFYRTSQKNAADAADTGFLFSKFKAAAGAGQTYDAYALADEPPVAPFFLHYPSFVNVLNQTESVDASLVAVEDINDVSPNNNHNGLCEARERCIMAPNYGSYQGHGEMLSFSDTTMSEFVEGNANVKIPIRGLKGYSVSGF